MGTSSAVSARQSCPVPRFILDVFLLETRGLNVPHCRSRQESCKMWTVRWSPACKAQGQSTGLNHIWLITDQKSTMHTCNLSTLGLVAFSALRGKCISVSSEWRLRKWIKREKCLICKGLPCCHRKGRLFTEHHNCEKRCHDYGPQRKLWKHRTPFAKLGFAMWTCGHETRDHEIPPQH